LKKILMILIFSFSILSASVAWAKEPATPEFTIEKAIQEALLHSAAIKSAEYDVDRAYEVRQFASDKLEFVPVGPADSDVLRPFYALKQADINWQMSRKALDIQKDAVEISARSSYNAILQAQAKVKTCEASLKSAEKQRILAAANFRVGLINQQALLSAETNLANAKAELEAAKKSLDDAYQKFNQLVGLWPEDRPVLTEVPDFEKLTVYDLDSYIERTLEENPNLWLAKEKVDLAKTMLGTYDFTNPAEPYKAKQLDVDKAIISASDARDQARKSLRSLYYTVTGLEEQYAPATEQVRMAEENLRVIKIKFEVGMATSAEVAQAESALAQAKQQVLDIVCQHDILKLAFSKPWAYASTAS